MEFDPTSEVVKLCLRAMALEEKGELEGASELFLQAWKSARSDLEKFISAHYLARHQASASERLRWLESALESASRANQAAVASAFPSLFARIAECHEELGNAAKAKESMERAASAPTLPADQGPFFHGTKADLKIGDVLTAGGGSNYVPGLRMNHIYFTALIHGAGLAAALAKGEGSERVFVVEASAAFENDPNVTNTKFPGNPTRSYRSQAPLRIVGEVSDWRKQSPEELQRWKEKLARNKGDIIN